MHNAYVRGGVGSGAWTNYPVAHGALEQLDQYVFQSINGDLGGTWAPASIIEIGGSGLKVTGVLVVDGIATFNSSVNLTSTTTVTGAFVVNSSASFNATTVATASLQVTATGSFTGDAGSSMTWSGAAIFQTGALTFKNGASFNTGGAVGVAVPWTFAAGSSVDFAAGITVTNRTALALAGAGHITYRPPITTGLDADITIAVTNGDYFRPPAITANRIWVVADGVPGDKIEVSLYLDGGTNTLTLRRADSSTIVVMQQATSKVMTCTLLCTLASGWIVYSAVGGPAVY